MPWNQVKMTELELVEAKLSPQLWNIRKILAPNIMLSQKKYLSGEQPKMTPRGVR